jgi:hypothetical protein
MITPGAERAAELISTELRKNLPELPESLQEVLARLINEATGIGELVELLQKTVQSFSEWLEVYGPLAAGGEE